MPVQLHNTDIAYLASMPVRVSCVIQYLIGILTIVVTPIFSYAVTYKSGRDMPTYRRFMLALIPFGLLNTTLITGYQPIYFVQHAVHVSSGLFKYFGTNVLIFETMLIFAVDTIEIEILLFMLIHQYFITSNAMKTPKRRIQHFVYGFLFLSSAISCAFVVAYFCVELLPVACGQICLVLKTNINAIFFMFQLIQIIEFCVFAMLCVRLLKNLSCFCHRTIKHHVMLIRVVLLQSVLIFLFGRPYQIIMALLFVLKQNRLTNLVGLYGICACNATFVGIMLIALYFVKPYKRFVHCIFKSVFH